MASLSRSAGRPSVASVAAPLLWAAAFLGAAWLPPAVALVPGLAVLRGPLGVVLAALAVTQALARLTMRRGLLVAVRSRIGSGLLAFGVAFALYLTVGLWYTTRLRVSGDEPHYLLMAQSLWREGDLDLRDNLAREDWREYTPGPIGEHYGAPRKDGRPYPAHSPGLPWLLAPVYAAGRRPAVVVVLASATASLVALVRLLALRLGVSQAAAWMAWAAAIGPPVFFYSFHVYTEGLSALALYAGLGLVTATPAAPAAALAGLLAGALPWLHVKMIAAAAVVGGAAAWRLRGRALAAFAVAAGLMATGYAAYLLHVFGRPAPLAIYGGAPSQMSGAPAAAVFGLLFDRSFGLIPHAPVFLVGLAGLVPLCRRWRQTWPLLLGAAAVLAPVLPWRMWWGGQSPAGRFVVPLVPVLAIAVALRKSESPRGLARWTWPLASLGMALGLFATARPGDLMLLNRGDRPTRLWAALSGDVPVERYLPSLVGGSPEEWRVAAVWTAALAVLLGLDRLAMRRESVDRLFRSLGFALGGLLLLSFLIDAWARPAGPPDNSQEIVKKSMKRAVSRPRTAFSRAHRRIRQGSGAHASRGGPDGLDIPLPQVDRGWCIHAASAATVPVWRAHCRDSRGGRARWLSCRCSSGAVPRRPRARPANRDPRGERPGGRPVAVLAMALAGIPRPARGASVRGRRRPAVPLRASAGA